MISDSSMTSGRMLLITGMHRSGTSLVAGWLHACGMDLGEDFYEPTYGNPLGHFEDLDFVGFHKRALERQGLDFVLTPDQVITTTIEDTKDAYALLREKPGRQQWGWKDPRSALFLDFWRARLANVRVLGLYRPFSTVVDSLMRRDLLQPASAWKKSLLPVWHSPKNRWLTKRYLGTWIRYNEALLAFADAYPDDVVLVRTDAVLQDEASLRAKLTGAWDFHLDNKSIATVYDTASLNVEVPDVRFPKKLAERARVIFEQLEAHRARSLGVSKQGGQSSSNASAASSPA